MYLSTGCLFVGPPWEAPLNQTPEVISPPTPENTLVIVGDAGKPRVVARDPDGDVLHFLWDVPPDFLQEVEDVPLEEGVYASTATITADPRLDGTEIDCVVTDYLSTPAVRVRWIIEVWE